MSPVVIALTVALSAAPGPAVKKLAMPALSIVGVSAEFSRFASEHFAQELSNRGLSVTTDREIASIIGFERQKELIGCSNESTSCLAELAGALGVDGLVLGDIGKFGEVYRVNLKIVSASSGEKLATASFKATSENEVLDQLTESAKKFAQQLSPTAGEAAVVEAPAKPGYHPYRSKAWIPAVAALAFAGFGTYEAFQAKTEHDALVGGGVQGTAEGERRARAGETAQTLSGVAFGLAGASLAAAATLYLLTGDEPSATVMLTPNSATVSFAATF